MKLTENQKRDYAKYYVANPDSTFSPQRNKEIVEGTIEKYELKRKKQHNVFIESLKERVNATVSLFFSNKGICHRCPSGFTGLCPHNTLERYFGRKYLAYLQGQRIIQKIKRLSNGQQIITLEEVA